MSFSIDSCNQALDKLLAQAELGRDPKKSKDLLRRIDRLLAKRRSALKPRASSRKVWWPSSCRV